MSLNGELGREEILLVERLALAAWPGLESARIDGWLARYSFGITRRANSVWPNELTSTMSLDERLSNVENFYRKRQVRARFQICPSALPDALDELLAERGYRAVARTAVQTSTVTKLMSNLGETVQTGVVVTSNSLPAWWSCYAEADEVSEESVAVRQQICAAIREPMAYAMVFRAGRVIAVGSAVANEGWIGFFNIATLSQHRRTGAARSVMAGLCQWGAGHGATRAYLQVMEQNDAAVKLYSSLGFATGYYYHYREQPD